MGLWDFITGKDGVVGKCAYCSLESEELPYKKRIKDQLYAFCSRECSHEYRLMRRRQERNPI
ncbi:MAG: hypothetical protein GF416_09360 [Candidatus Altiarchaeales archaeon]|nr:hypothetical protein [Candidatus Altiarchaeales archaeon]MBD3417327.1 hypothetical protein [Candidatus Altiarchaeales archaeon]